MRKREEGEKPVRRQFPALLERDSILAESFLLADALILVLSCDSDLI